MPLNTHVVTIKMNRQPYISRRSKIIFIPPVEHCNIRVRLSRDRNDKRALCKEGLFSLRSFTRVSYCLPRSQDILCNCILGRIWIPACTSGSKEIIFPISFEDCRCLAIDSLEDFSESICGMNIIVTQLTCNHAGIPFG